MSGLPTSGYEIVYGDPRWESKRGIRNNNCYSYAMNDYKPHRDHKAVVGDLGGFKHDIKYNSCKELDERILKDNPGRIYPTSADVPCKQGYYKIMMVVAPAQDATGYGDFHFYKQHKDIVYTTQPGDTVHSIARFFGISAAKVILANGRSARLAEGTPLMIKDVHLWSHKRGWATPPLLTDACGKVIRDPRKACRTYSMDYKDVCGSFCVRSGRVRTSNV
jgi:hypothetical protein